MKDFLKNSLAILAISGLAFLSGHIIGNLSSPQPTAGATNAVAGISYYLYGSGVAATDSSITLTSFKQPVNAYPLAMADFGSIGYLTLEPGNSSRQEFVSFTGVTQNADGTATLTGITRGLAPVSPYTASTTIRKAHSGGTIAVLSNPPQFYDRFANKDNTQYITGAWGFQGTAPTSTECATANELCNKNYIDTGILSGGASASETVKGITELATAAELAAGTSAGGTGARLVIPSSQATSTPTASTATGAVPTTVGRYLVQGWLDLTQHFSLSSLFATNASSTHATTTDITITGILSSLVKTDANGLASAATVGVDYGLPSKLYASTTPVTTTQTSSTTVFAFNIPANTLGTSNQIKCDMYSDAASQQVTSIPNSGTLAIDISYGGTATSTTILTQSSGSTQQNGFASLLLSGNGSTASQKVSLVGVPDVSASRLGIYAGFSIDSTSAHILYVRALGSSSSYFAPTQVSCWAIR